VRSFSFGVVKRPGKFPVNKHKSRPYLVVFFFFFFFFFCNAWVAATFKVRAVASNVRFTLIGIEGKNVNPF
jgi:hypothetical protein